MEVENKSGKEVVYSTADGGQPLDPRFQLTILFWLWALLLRLRVALSASGVLRHWCFGKSSCWGMFFRGESPYEPDRTKEWESCYMRVMVLKLPLPKTLRGMFNGPPKTVQIVYENGSYKLYPIY